MQASTAGYAAVLPMVILVTDSALMLIHAKLQLLELLTEKQGKTFLHHYLVFKGNLQAECLHLFFSGFCPG